MPEIVGTPGQQRCGFAGGEGGSAGLVEDLEIGPVVEDPAPRAGEDAPVPAGRVLLDLVPQQLDQLGVDGYRAGLAARAVLEFTALAGGALSVHQVPLRGSELVSTSSPQPCSGRLARLPGRRSTASSGRRAA